MTFKTLLTGAFLASFAASAAGQTIAEIACAEGSDFSTLCAAVGAAGLAETLSGGEYTVFAPNDEAFAKLPEGTVEALLEDIPTLTDILLYHVVAGSVTSSDLEGMALVEMANGEDTRTIFCHSCSEESIFQKGKGNPRDEDNPEPTNYEDVWPKIIAADIEADNGYIHVVNNVILP